MKPAAKYEIKDAFISGDAFTTAVYKSFDSTNDDDRDDMDHGGEPAEHHH